jgi:DNA-binding MarR family transcriptional regulator
MTGSTRWLSGDEQRAWRAFLEAQHLLWEHLERELQAHSEFTHSDYEILVRLSEAGGRRLRMAQLADDTLYSRSRLSHAVGRLETAGYVTRESCPDDKRGTIAVMTEAGFAALEKAAPYHVESVRSAVFDVLTPEQVGQLECIAAAIRGGLQRTD